MARIALTAVSTVFFATMTATQSVALPPLQQRAGEPILGLTPNERALFELGKVAYSTPRTAENGLGPAFNATNCATCHESPIGGWGGTTVQHFAILEPNGTFNFLEELGGPVRQRLALSPACSEQLPESANHVRERVTPSVLAFGLVEALADAQLEANADPDDSDGDGVSGRVHWVQPIESDASSPLRAGRFGWKAQIATVLSFSADAGRTEMGITNRVVGDETAPNGDVTRLNICDATVEPEDAPRSNGLEFIDSITFFQRYLGPPPQSPRLGMTGEVVFNETGCAKCHTPSFTTPNDPSLESALRNKTFRPYSDFLLHDMGDMDSDGIGDGIPAGDAGRMEMKTPPLWNMRDRPAMLHDGSASEFELVDKIELAIARHGGEASSSRANYDLLSQTARDQLTQFLDSLGRLEFDIDGDGIVNETDYALLVPHIGRTDISPDEPCAVADINGDGAIDEEERAHLADLSGISADCNQNGLADALELANGTSSDGNGNGVPDECDEAVLCHYRVVRMTKTVESAIPDALASVLTSSMEVPSFVAGRVVKVGLTVDLAHTWLSDVRIGLTNLSLFPLSTKLALNNTVCSSCSALGGGVFSGAKFAANLDGRFSFNRDGATIPCQSSNFVFSNCVADNCETCVDLLAATYRVNGAASAAWFDSVNPAVPTTTRAEGPWTLTISDHRTNDVGHVRSWTLDIVYRPDAFLLAEDCDDDGVPNTCDDDLDFDGVSDVCEQVQGARDCNANGIFDDAEIFVGTAFDCNANEVIDACEVDSDRDGVIDACDGCPNTASLVVAGVCGCAPVVDSDSDGTPNCDDLCPNDAGKISPGLCGCGVSDLDSDSDGVPNCDDGCANDPNKIAPGDCGCGVTEADADFDGVPDCNDGCPNDSNKIEPGACGCGVSDSDSDGDGVATCVDNCPSTPNTNQADSDGDGIGNACEGEAPPDCDRDGQSDADEIAAGALDCNSNGVPDSCDVTSSAFDCNENDLVDFCEIAADPSSDCNFNGALDSCDLAAGTSTDLDNNTRPDECEFIVGGSGFDTLQSAIAAAPDDTTILVAAGTHVGTFAILGKSLTIRSLAGAANTILSGVGLTGDSIITVEGATTDGTVIDGFTVRDGSVGHRFGAFQAGGGLFCFESATTVRNCRFESNTAAFGAAMYAVGFSGRVENCIFDDNDAGEDGGGILIGLSLGAWQIVDCTFTQNSATVRGGAAHIWSSSGSFTNCTMTSNSTQGVGAAVSWYLPESGVLLMDACTIEQNSAPDGALVAFDGVGCFDLRDCFLCRNTPANVIGCINDLGGNTLSSDCDSDGICDAIEIAGNATLDCDNDGVLNACEIASGAIDCDSNGIPDSCSIAANSALDLNGNGQLDICESASTRFVPSAQFPTIQSALIGVPAGGITVLVQPGTYAVNASTGGALNLTAKKVILKSSGGPTQTILDGTGLDDSILRITWANNAERLASNGSVIDGFTFRNGTTGSFESFRKGGAIVINGGGNLKLEATIRNCVFLNNAAEFGGAIYAKLFKGSIATCTFDGNHSAANAPTEEGGDGGSVLLFRGEWLFTGNIVSNNSATVWGGAVHVVGPLTNCEIRECTIAGNSSPIGSGCSWAQNDAIRIAAGGANSAATTANSLVKVWGDNSFGQLAVPNNPGTTTPLNSVMQLEVGTSFFVANRRSTDPLQSPIICWGLNTSGQCNPPASLAGVLVAHIAAGARHGVALTFAGEVVCWGDNASGQCDVPAGMGFVAQVAAGDAHTMALSSDTTVRCFGSNDFGQCSGAPNLIGVVQIAAGARHSVALRANGTVAAWGDNSSSQCTVPIGLTQVVALDAGSDHTVVRKADDTVACWGSNAFGQCTVPPSLGPVAGVSAGARHTEVRLVSGAVTVICWGDNSSSQCTVPTGSAGPGTDTIGMALRVADTVVEGNAGGSTAAFITNGPLCYSLDNVILCDNSPANFFGCFESLGDVHFSQDCDDDGVCDASEILGGDEADLNGNMIPDACESIPEDLNADGFINAADLAIFLAQWGSSGPLGDFDGDGNVGAFDLSVLLAAWGD